MPPRLSFPAFFQSATGHAPYLWQCRLACGEPPPGANADLINPDTATLEWLQGGNPCISRLIDIPTGLGKTAGVVLAWLWNVFLWLAEADNRDAAPAWPRRLIYCLPMRTLVEQTEGEVRLWLKRLRDAYAIPFNPRVVVLMGGESPEGRDKDWDLYPEDPAILIGTQDMLLSRALNRGYGMSRYRWPMHFALLNNDALWVMDEVQLMGPGLAASTQLEGFRSEDSGLGSQRTYSWWMSATIRPDWLLTVDFPYAILNQNPFRLTAVEKEEERTHALHTAPKQLKRASVDSGSNNLKAVAQFICEQRSALGLNLVVANTVRRARELHLALSKALKGNSLPPLLLHSQFRPADRLQVLEAIKAASPGQIVVSTQVIEAGIDLSAHKLFTELAPWSSLVQRFGRCNRWLTNGQHHYSDARIFWFDLPDEKDHLPYKSGALGAAKERIENFVTAAVECLESVSSPDADRPEFRHVVRRKDLVDLFDTTSDLAGADIDIDRFIRDADDSHVQVFWRNWSGRDPNGDNENTFPEKAPQRAELCTVSIGDFKAFIKKQGPAYRWDALIGLWKEAKDNDLYPGQVYLLHTNLGGYQGATANTLPAGWSANPKSTVHPVPSVQSVQSDAYPADSTSETDSWQTIAQHTDAVCAEQTRIINALGPFISTADHTALSHAARWHDWGKGHPAFQAKIKCDALADSCLDAPAAKAPQAAWIRGRIPRHPTEGDPRRPQFRHELASALGVLLADSGFPETKPTVRDLAAYLIATHHGKVRLSIRSMPEEWRPGDERRFARGIWDDDVLPSVNLGDNTHTSAVTLSLEPMELGLGENDPFLNQPSWAERCLCLRDALGPFHLAYLEALLRAADARASSTTTIQSTSET